MIDAFGPHGVTQTGAVIAVLVSFTFAAVVMFVMKRASQSGGGKALDAEDKQTAAELQVGYTSEPTAVLPVVPEPLDMASAHDVEPTPDDEVEIPFLTPTAWAERQYEAIVAELRMAPPKPLVEPGWSFPTPPEVVDALSSGSGMTGFTREYMRELRKLTGDEAKR